MDEVTVILKLQHLDSASGQQWLLDIDSQKVLPQYFKPDYWQQQQKLLGQSQGRNVTWFVGEKSQPMVLRHYYRGGLIGKLINDCYIFSGIKNTRAYREFSLLLQLEQLELPACRVVAAQVTRSGLIYRADLLMKMVEGGQDLVALLSKGSLTEQQWQNIGHTIAQFHQARVYHADLNAHNILIDNDDKVWLIDFDRGEIKAQQGQWCQQNLDRLLRSFKKERNKLDNFYYRDQDWQTLLSAYQAGY